MTCLKCGSTRHDSKICTGPVTSFGLIVFKESSSSDTGRMYPTTIVNCKGHSNIQLYSVHKLLSKLREKEAVVNPKIFLVERKDTIAFIKLVQGMYTVSLLKKLVKELTCHERHKLLHLSFDDLWNVAGSQRKNKLYSERKFRQLREELSMLFEQVPCRYREADYVMPKGRLKSNENTVKCALREFSEETGYSQQDIQVLYNYPLFIDDFTGSDGKTYRNVFYIATIKEGANLLFRLGENPMQSKEVGNMGWFGLTEAMGLIRDNQKKRILIDSYDLVCKYRTFKRANYVF